MREIWARPPGTLRIADDLHGEDLAALVYGPNASGNPLLRLNRAILRGDDFDRVLSWARREIARDARMSLLLADELADLA